MSAYCIKVWHALCYTAGDMGDRDTAQAFLAEAVRREALRFGNFRLKSGRTSPYFFDMGTFYDAQGLAFVATHYTHTLLAQMTPSVVENKVLFGPAYKGIPLAIATAQHLFAHNKLNIPCAFDRKEVKDHGEGGAIVGADLRDKEVIIVDDVLSAGTAARRAVEVLRGVGAQPVALLVAFDRNEHGTEKQAARIDMVEQYGLDVLSVMCFDDVLSYVSENAQYTEYQQALEEYRQRYGA